MKIRETCDESGNVIKSEVVNVSNAMKRLGDGLKSVTDAAGDGGEGDGRRFGELLARILKRGKRDITSDAHEFASAPRDVRRPTTRGRRGRHFEVNLTSN